MTASREGAEAMTIEAGTPGRETEVTAGTEDTAEDTVLADAQ